MEAIISPGNKVCAIRNDYNMYRYYPTFNRPCCSLEEKIIYCRYATFVRDDDDVFDLLHEIGHLQTNTNQMLRYEQELLATEWAIQHCAKYNVTPSKEYKLDVQKYIDSWYYFAKKHKSKRIPLTPKQLQWQTYMYNDIYNIKGAAEK